METRTNHNGTNGGSGATDHQPLRSGTVRGRMILRIRVGTGSMGCEHVKMQSLRCNNCHTRYDYDHRTGLLQTCSCRALTWKELSVKRSYKPGSGSETLQALAKLQDCTNLQRIRLILVLCCFTQVDLQTSCLGYLALQLLYSQFQSLSVSEETKQKQRSMNARCF